MRRGVLLATGCAAAIASCFSSVPLDGLPCPCVAGYACVDGICQPAGSTDAGSLPADATGDRPSEAPPGVDAGQGNDAGVEDTGNVQDAVADGVPEGASPYAATVMADHPIVYWRLDEDAGSQARDFSEGGNPGLYSDGGVVLGATGALLNDPDPAVRLNGGFVSAGTDFAFGGQSSFTIELWVYANSLTTGFQRIVSREEPDAQAPREGYLVYVREPSDSGTNPDLNRVSFERWLDGGHQPFPYAGDADLLLSWHHVVATYDGSQPQKQGCIYLDARSLCTTSTTGLDLPSANYPFLVGKGPDIPPGNSSSFDGVVDEVAVYAYALTATQVAAHYAASGR